MTDIHHSIFDRRKVSPLDVSAAKYSLCEDANNSENVENE
jgi:hypothetical protein